MAIIYTLNSHERSFSTTYHLLLAVYINEKPTNHSSEICDVTTAAENQDGLESEFPQSS